jgi:alpha-galactosidase
MSDDNAGLRVEIWIELLEQGVVRARAEATNTGAGEYFLEELSLVFPVPLSADEILDFSGTWGREREPQRARMTMGCHLREGRHGRTGFDAPDMMFCGERGFSFERGRVWGLHVAHSGNHRSWVERCPDGNQVLGGGELLLPGEVCLASGDSYATPWLYLERGDGLDDAARRLHRWERALPAHPGPVRPVTLNVWEAVYFDQDVDVLIRLADRAAAVGTERFVLDDGWFRHRRNDRAGLGDWEVDPDVWPEGLHPLVDHVRALGMEFGLWVEPEMVNPDSDLARAHPEWILRAGPDYPLEWRHQQVLNLSDPQAWEHIHRKLCALLEEYDIAALKWDHNRDLVASGDPARSGRPAVREQTLAVYRMMDVLRSEHPGLEIESCASGGGRIDLGMIEHVQRFWISDCIDPHERQAIARWTGQLVAPEYMGSHIASPRSHTTGRVSDLSFRAGTAIWGHLGFEWNLLGLSDEELRVLGEWVGFYKANRSLLLGGDVVRRDIGDGSVWLHGVVARDRSRALYQLTTRDRPSMSALGTFPLPGLTPDTRYRVRPNLVGGGPGGLNLPAWARGDEAGIEAAGRQLSDSGLQVPLMDPDQVLLLEVEEAAV